MILNRLIIREIMPKQIAGLGGLSIRHSKSPNERGRLFLWRICFCNIL